MFTNPGKKIKKVSIAVFWLAVLVYVVLAFTVGVDSGFGIFIILLVLCPLCAYLSTLFLVAFGELGENSAKTEFEKKKIQISKVTETEEQKIKEQIVWPNDTRRKEDDADPNLTNEEIEAELEAEINR